MFDGFEMRMVETSTGVIRARCAGDGPPLLLLHGHPETHVMWHRVAPRLAGEFTVVASDLTGYGQSCKPEAAADHSPYTKRAMAATQIEVMQSLGHEQFFVAGHDRGARVGYRMALDHPERVQKLAVLDIVPTSEAFDRADHGFGMAYWHWFFLSQPYPFPERVLEADPRAFYARLMADYISDEARADYFNALADPATIHAICEDYRAAETTDSALDRADHGARSISCPLLVLWGERGHLQSLYDVLAIWSDWADDLRGRALPCGHHLPEEAPDETYGALSSFFGP
jgi:haloacetate dehalogenase